MVLIALFATALFRMAKSGHTHQAKAAFGSSATIPTRQFHYKMIFNGRLFQKKFFIIFV